jgi:inositol oxygenase
VTSEAYPLGCAFSEHISGNALLTTCPDRRCSCYSSPHGVYSPGCGLDSVHFTWTATEYLTMLLLLNQTRLPFEAVFLLRFQNFFSAIDHNAYSELYSARDCVAMPLLRRFASACARARHGATPPGPRLSRVALEKQCGAAIARYFPTPHLRW